MLLQLTDLSDEPLQSQIIRQIRAMILSGELPSGSSLPSIRSLARDQRISVITVQRAYEQLLREKLIHSRRGKGFFVSEIDARSRKDLAFDRLYENLEKPLTEALSEGMSPEDIHHTVTRLLRNLKKSP